jgi:hypothetical protein
MAFPLLGILAGASAGGQVLGGLAGNKGAKESASAQVRAGRIEFKAAQANAKLFDAQAKQLQRNAKEAIWRGKFIAGQIKQQSDINTFLSGIEYTEQLRMADVIDRQSGQALSLALSKEAEFGIEAKAVDDAAMVAGVRQAKAGREFLGRERQATASSGFVGSGSELDRLVESSSRLESDRFSMATEAANESRRLRYGGALARFEGEVARFEGVEQTRQIKFSAEIGKFTAGVDALNAQQEAAVVLRDARTTAANLRSEARDAKTRAKLTRQYGKAGMEAANSGASATRTAGRLGVVSAVAGAAGSVAQWQDRYGGIGTRPKARVRGPRTSYSGQGAIFN